MENLGRVSDAIFRSWNFRLRLLLELRVKVPLVNLIARQPCIILCLLAVLEAPVPSLLEE